MREREKNVLISWCAVHFRCLCCYFFHRILVFLLFYPLFYRDVLSVSLSLSPSIDIKVPYITELCILEASVFQHACGNFCSAKLCKILHTPDEKLNYRKFHNIHNSNSLDKFLVTEFMHATNRKRRVCLCL